MQHNIIHADDGELLHLHQMGHGIPVLLLHGWTASHSAWSPLLKPLNLQHPGVCLLRPDARGHGGHTLQVNSAPDVRRLARDVINLLDQLQIDRVAAVGHSMGALTLWQCIQDFGTQRFSHLAFIDQSPKLITDAHWRGGIYGDFDAAQSQRFVNDLDEDFAESVLRLAAFGLNAKARETYLRNSSGWRAAREALRRLDAPPQIAIWQSLVAADYRAVLPLIDVPTLLAYGSCSNFYTEETAGDVAAHIPQARLSIYETADHGPHLSQPERFASELVALLRA
jgi:pimeloyl-ACP methyl ester carboxylesterase